MPRTLVRSPEHDRSRSLGFLAVAWVEYFVRHGPGDVQGQRIRHGDEYTGFIVDCYGLDHLGRLLYDSAFLSRPKGCNKSGLAAEFVLFEAFGPCRFAGWAKGGEVYTDPWGLGFRYVYEAGEPMGRPVTVPFVRIMATEEEQSGNVYDNVYFNLTDDKCPLSFIPGIDVSMTGVYLPGGGEIRCSTAAAASKDGGKETFAAFDESHLYTTSALRQMYKTVTRNLRKRKKIAGTWYLETTTMFNPADNSTAQRTFAEAEAIREGRKRRGRARLLYDHRWGECEKLSREDMLRAAILEAFGEAIEWNDIDGIVDECYDTRTDEQDFRRYFLNAKVSASDAWLKEHQWNACKRPDRALRDGDTVTLGMDGSIRDDATALVATRVADGHQELLGCWEKPDGRAGEGWQVDRVAVDAAVADAMRRFNVVGFFADPAHWQDYLDTWHARYAEKMRVKATANRPLEWWTNRPKPMGDALQRYHEAVLEKRVSYTPAEDRTGRAAELAVTFSRHVLNARDRPGRYAAGIGKEAPHSSKKIDAAVAAVLSYEAACDARAAGITGEPEHVYLPKRLR